MCLEFTTRWYVYRDRERWHNSQEGGRVASCNEPIHYICAINFDPAYPCIIHLPLPNLSWIRTSFTNGDFTNTKALHSCMHRHTTPHGYCWGSMNERAQVLNSVPSIPSGGFRSWKFTRCPSQGLKMSEMNKDTQNIREHISDTAIPSHHIIFALQTPPLDGQSGPISCARHAACYLCRRGQRSLYKRIMGYREGIPKLEFYQKDGSTSLQKCPSEGVCWATGANLFWKRWAFWP